MRRLFVAALGAVLLLMGCAHQLGGSTTRLVRQSGERAVYLVPEVRAQLVQAWDTLNPRQHERAYCLGAKLVVAPSGDSVWVVGAATRAVALTDGPAHTQFDCGSRPTLHTHNPTTCRMVIAPDFVHYDYESCQFGGPGKDVTWPSPGDYVNLEASGRPFDLIQFGPHGYTVYYPRRKQ